MHGKLWSAARIVLVLLLLAFEARAQAQPPASITFSPSGNITETDLVSARLSYWCPTNAQTVAYQTWPSTIHIYTSGACVATPPPGPGYAQPSVSIGRLALGTYGVFWHQQPTPGNPFNTTLASTTLTVVASAPTLVGAPMWGILAMSFSAILLLLSGAVALKKGRVKL